LENFDMNFVEPKSYKTNTEEDEQSEIEWFSD
jgi:hypothetical protein